MKRNAALFAGIAVAIAGFFYLVWAAKWGPLGLLMGITVHALKALTTAKVATGDTSGLNVVTYFTKYWVQSLLALVCALSIWFALPELASAFGDYTKSVGITPATAHGYLPGFMCGLFGDMLVDFLGGRVKTLYSTNG